MDTPLTIQYQEKFQSYRCCHLQFKYRPIENKNETFKRETKDQSTSSSKEMYQPLCPVQETNGEFSFHISTGQTRTYQPADTDSDKLRAYTFSTDIDTIKDLSHIGNNIFSVLTDYLLGQANTTLEYDCIRQLSKSLPVTLLDFDGNTVIPPYNMRTGTDQKFMEYTLIVCWTGGYNGSPSLNIDITSAFFTLGI